MARTEVPNIPSFLRKTTNDTGLPERASWELELGREDGKDTFTRLTLWWDGGGAKVVDADEKYVSIEMTGSWEREGLLAALEGLIAALKEQGKLT